MPQQQEETFLIRFEETLTASAHSPATIVNYLADVRDFWRWGRQEFGDQFGMSTVTQEHIRLYRYYLAQNLERAAATVNRRLMALRKFFAFAHERGWIARNPTDGVSLVQNNRQTGARPLSDEEVERLFQAASQGSRAGLVRRDTAVIQLLLRAGLRVSEIVRLQMDDIQFGDPGVWLNVGGQNNGAGGRRVPLPAETYKALSDYLQVRPQTGQPYIFLSQDGRPLSQRTIQRIVSNCARSAGLNGVSAQSLRRTFAQNLFRETGSLELVSERLGHQNCSITEQYLLNCE
ncbi:MAG: hypothetical protein D6784_12795 [Chloroflexi bacterium]|nr:MAG: hypothetical protein D6784_12795 [Chloroflexota bacterium]